VVSPGPATFRSPTGPFSRSVLSNFQPTYILRQFWGFAPVFWLRNGNGFLQAVGTPEWRGRGARYRSGVARRGGTGLRADGPTYGAARSLGAARTYAREILHVFFGRYTPWGSKFSPWRRAGYAGSGGVLESGVYVGEWFSGVG